MNMQTTIKVRKGRGLTNPIGQHMTLIKVSNDQSIGKVFGFAVNDEGEEAFIPGALVIAHKMTSHDADHGAQFFAPLRSNPNEDSATRLVVTNPIQWDSDEETITVDVPDNEDDEDIVRLADAADGIVTDGANEIRAAIVVIRKLDIAAAIAALEATANKLESFRAYIDEFAS